MGDVGKTLQSAEQFVCGLLLPSVCYLSLRCLVLSGYQKFLPWDSGTHRAFSPRGQHVAPPGLLLVQECYFVHVAF